MNKGRVVNWVIGTAGKYQVSSDGVASRGYLPDPTTLYAQVFDFSNLVAYVFKFTGDSLDVTSAMLNGAMKSHLEDQ